MTEENTLSILKNIKKKMQKFDQEPKKIETFTGVNDEFEYIPSGKSNSFNDTAQNVSKAPAPQLAALEQEVDKDLKINTTTEEKAAAKAPEIFDDLGLDDLSDLDDHAPQPVTTAQASNPSVPPVLTEEVVSQSKLDDDLDELSLDHLDDHGDVKHVTPPTPSAPIDLHDLDFDLDLDHVDVEAKSTTTIPAQPVVTETKKEQASTSKQDVDDIDLDELLKEDNAKKTPAAPLQNLASPSKKDDDEQFLKDLEKEVLTKAQNSSPVTPKAEAPKDSKENQTKSIRDELLEDIDLDDLDDMEEKMVAEPSENNVPEQEVAEPSENNAPEQEVAEPSENNVPEQEFETLEHHPKQEPVVSQKKEIILPPLDLGTLNQTETRTLEPSKNSHNELEDLLQKQNFAEIAMHLLEPKLDMWLDEHLHGLVEKIVQEEVKKLFEKR